MMIYQKKNTGYVIPIILWLEQGKMRYLLNVGN